jgi:hypothetical protein
MKTTTEKERIGNKGRNVGKIDIASDLEQYKKTHCEIDFAIEAMGRIRSVQSGKVRRLLRRKPFLIGK